MEGWADFTQDMRHFYGVDMNCLDNSYRREQKEYYLETSVWADIHPSQLLGPACCFKEYDLLHVTLEELAAPLQVRVAIPSDALCRQNMGCSNHADLVKRGHLNNTITVAWQQRALVSACIWDRFSVVKQ